MRANEPGRGRTTSSRQPLRFALSVVLGIAVVLAGCEAPDFERATAPAPAFGSQATVELLVRLKALHLVVPGGAAWEIPRLPKRGSATAADECPPALYATGPAIARRLPSTLLAGRATEIRGVPVVSLAAESCRLERLYGHPTKRGRRWEEPAFLSIFDDRDLLFESAIGFRLHGNSSRLKGRRHYRLVTRTIYGDQLLPGEIVGLTPGSGIERLILKRDTRKDSLKRAWPFVTALAWDIARQIGALAPHGRSVLLILNGEPQGPHVLVERIDEDFLERHLGPGPWQISNDKGARHSIPWLWKLIQEHLRSPATMRLERLERELDLDSLIRWHVAIVLCASGDTDQATMVRRPGERWQWVSWDMDHSFHLRRPKGRVGWESPRLQATMRRANHHRSLTGRLLWILLAGNEEFRRRYIATALDILDNRFTPEFTAERLAHYSRLTEAMDLADRRFLPEIASFLELRPDVVRRNLATVLGVLNSTSDEG